MPKYFVSDAPVAIPEFDPSAVISDVAPNVIYIKAKMDVATKAKVTSEMFSLGKGGDLEARLGANEMALLIHNIVRWEGPDLGSVPCTPENIKKLDPTEPHIAKVLEEIATRNRSPKAPKASATSDTSTSDTSIDLITRPSQALSPSAPSANGQLRSPLRRSLDGHLSRSDD